MKPKGEKLLRMSFLSTNREWHSFAWGVYRGFTSKALTHPSPPDTEDVEQEPHYYRGGYILGTIFQLVVIVGVSYGAFNSGVL